MAFFSLKFHFQTCTTLIYDLKKWKKIALISPRSYTDWARPQLTTCLRLVRVVRTLRIVKLSRYSRGLRILGLTIYRSARVLTLLVMFQIVLAVTFGSFVYYMDMGQSNIESLLRLCKLKNELLKEAKNDQKFVFLVKKCDFPAFLAFFQNFIFQLAQPQ